LRKPSADLTELDAFVWGLVCGRAAMRWPIRSHACARRILTDSLRADRRDAAINLLAANIWRSGLPARLRFTAFLRPPPAGAVDMVLAGFDVAVALARSLH